MSTIDALSRGPKYMSDSNGLSAGQDRLDYLASPELVDILTRFMLGGRSPEQVEEGVTHPMDPNRDRTTYLSQQPPPTDILGSAMHRGDPLAWMEQVQEPEGTPEPSLVETLARKAPQLAEQIAIMGGAAKGMAGGMRGQPRMAWEPQFGAEKPRPASTGPRKPSELLDSDLTTSESPAQPKQVEPSQELIDILADKRVYHGSQDVRGIERGFDPGKANAESLFGPGIYTTDSPEVASTYTRKGRKMDSAEGVVPMKLTSEKIIDMDKPAPPELVKKFAALENVDYPVDAKGNPQFDNATDFYHYLTQAFGTKADANDWLAANGIEVIKYKGGERIPNSPQHTAYVVIAGEGLKGAYTGKPMSKQFESGATPRPEAVEGTPVEALPGQQRFEIDAKSVPTLEEIMSELYK